MAAEVEEVQRRDPELLSRMLTWAVTRRSIYDQLSTRERETAEHQEIPGSDGSTAARAEG